MRPNSGGTGLSRRLRSPTTGGIRSGVPGVHDEALERRSRAITTPGGSRDRAVHTRAQLVHTRDNSVERLMVVGGETPTHLPLAPARSGGAAPEIRAALTHRFELVPQHPRTAGERRA